MKLGRLPLVGMLIAAGVSTSAMAMEQYHTHYGPIQGHFQNKLHDTCFPKNHLDALDQVNGPSNITEQLFNQIIDNVLAYYQPLAKLHGATLGAEKRWDDPTVNAYADEDGDTWTVHMFGGLARRPEITPDGFAMVVCHELGHHFGGYAYYGDNDWAAAEGEADYFATQACAKNVFHNPKSFDVHFAQIASPVAGKACDATYADQRDRDVCYRTADAGQALANLLAALGGTPTPKFETPDTSVVQETYAGHPQAQCRLDTYFQGALCTNHFDDKTIPGRNPNGGETTADAEATTRSATCLQKDFKVGVRPLCWFKPLL